MMSNKEDKSLNFHIRHHSVKGITGSINWYGEDYTSFCHALDVTVQRLKQIKLKTPTPITVHVHDKSLSSTKINEWKDSYCSEKHEEYYSEYVLMKRQGFAFLIKGLFILWGALSLMYVIDHIHFLHPYVQMLGRETLYFMGWVILWKPIEMIVFETWLLKHQLKLIGKLQDTRLSTQNS
jgi:hypothetical protein